MTDQSTETSPGGASAKLRIIIPAVLALLIAIMAVVIYNKYQKKKEVEASIFNLPAFEFAELDGNIINHESLPEGKGVVIMYFDPGCGVCQDEIVDIIDEVAKRIERL